MTTQLPKLLRLLSGLAVLLMIATAAIAQPTAFEDEDQRFRVAS